MGSFPGEQGPVCARPWPGALPTVQRPPCCPDHRPGLGPGGLAGPSAQVFAESSLALLPLLRLGNKGEEEPQSYLEGLAGSRKSWKAKFFLVTSSDFFLFSPKKKKKKSQRVVSQRVIKCSGAVSLGVMPASGEGPRLQIKRSPQPGGGFQCEAAPLRGSSQAHAPPAGGRGSCAHLNSSDRPWGEGRAGQDPV